MTKPRTPRPTGIRDDNLKLALLNALAERGDLEGLIESAKSKAKGNGYRLEKAVRKALLARELTPVELASITKLSWGADANIIYDMFQHWDGEDDVFRLRDLAGIEACSKLEELDLGELGGVTDLSPLAGLTRLKSLSMPESRIEDLSPLAGLERLESIQLPFFAGSDLSPLRHLARLRQLRLGCRGRASAVSDLRPLLELPALAKVVIKREPANDREPGDSLAKNNAAVVDELKKRKVELELDDIQTPARQFKQSLGEPAPGTGLPLEKLGLTGIAFLEDLAREVGTGVFLEGAFSICSVREVGLDLVPWRKVKGLPKTAILFASNWLGELFFVRPNGTIYKLWVHEPFARDVDEMEDQPFLSWVNAPSDNMTRVTDWITLRGRRPPTELRPKQVCTLADPVVAGDLFRDERYYAEDLAKTLKRLAAAAL